MKQWRMTRRGFLIATGSAAALFLGGRYLLGEGRKRLAQGFGDATSGLAKVPTKPDFWFEVHPDNMIELFIPRTEFGQGVRTSLAQIAAEELNITWQQLEVKQADTTHGFNLDLMQTFGSTSVYDMFVPLREAAATLRQMIRLEAAHQFSVPEYNVVAHEGHLYLENGQPTPTKVTYGMVVAAKQGEWQTPNIPPLKPRSEFAFIGQALPRVDGLEKVTGRALYGYDIHVDGMVYGAVARPPRYGAKLLSTSLGKASEIPGFSEAVFDIKNNFAGVVASSRVAAWNAVRALDLEWTEGSTITQQDVEHLITVPDSGGTTIAEKGQVAKRVRGGKAITAQYRTPLVFHAPLEPQAALVQVESDRVKAWVSGQMVQWTLEEIAHVTGRHLNTIQLDIPYIGGSFGRKTGVDVAGEAARLSVATGKPVHVGWQRSEEMRYGYFRPPTHTVLKASLSGQGRITAWDQSFASAPAFGPKDLPGGNTTTAVLGFDGGAVTGFQLPYDVPHYRVVAHRIPLPIPTGVMRSAGSMPNTFAMETFMDELAHAVNRDPLEFRLEHLPDTELGERFRNTLLTVAEQAKWGEVLPHGQARGIACSVDGSTVVAHIAQVTVEDHQLRVPQFFAAVDAGLIVNPDGAKAQVEGSIVMGLSIALHETITIKNGMAEAENFDRYPLLRFDEAPEIDVAFTGQGEHPFGLGEPAIAPVGAALSNAIFALTGQRLRTLPLRLQHE